MAGYRGETTFKARAGRESKLSVEVESHGPDGKCWKIPASSQLEEQWREIEHAARGRTVVAVQGLGFVGAAAAAAVAAAKDSEGQPKYFVIGVDLPTPSAWWKIASLRHGESPFAASDAEFAEMLRRAATVDRNLTATSCERAYGLADVILVDVQLDVVSARRTDNGAIDVDLDSYKKALRSVGREMRPDALVIIETTVPLGTLQKVVRPILEEERVARGFDQPLRLAHAYERVMPGRRYLDSIRRFWRVIAAGDEDSRTRAEDFISSFTDTRAFPLTSLRETTASEMAKLLENSYRAANIAFIHEWTLLAEKSGVNLWEVVDAIRLRRGTHDNMRYPGFGVGGYCLTKDSYLAAWGAKNLLGLDCGLPVTLSALATNHDMPLHTLDLVRECTDGNLAGIRILLCGVSYLSDVADTRNSPSGTFVDAARAAGAVISYHDALVASWPEQPEVERVDDWLQSLQNFEVVVFAVPHEEYTNLKLHKFPRPVAVVDASNVVNDEVAAGLRAAGCRVAGAGKGHWKKSGWHLKQ